MRNIIQKVNNWCKERGIDTGNGITQLEKLTEECAELETALVLNPKNTKLMLLEAEDAIGDMQVVLICICQQIGLDFDDCLEFAYNEIKDRTGKTVDGIFVKDKASTQSYKNFNKDFVETYNEIQKEELKALGFVSDKGVAGCCTLPTCFQGKKPYEKGKVTACAIIRSMCSISPVEQMRKYK